MKTYRRTLEMLAVLRPSLLLEEMTQGELLVWRDPGKRAEAIIHTNPRNEILHTQLVERNGFLHAILFGTRFEEHAWTFWGAPANQEWISEDGVGL